MSPPTVSIVIPTYNRADLLRRALDSVITQTFTDWEIVLVDDGSTDGTEGLAAEYRRRLGDRLRYVQRENGGCGRARNTGIDRARGRFVAFLDSDDEFLPHKLARQMELFDLRPELGLVYGDYSFVDYEGVRHESVFDEISPLAREVPHTEIAPGLCVCHGSLFDTLIRGYFVATIVGMVRREVLGDAIRFPSDRAYAEEWLFYLHVARACPAGFVNEPLCLHHHVAGSLARTDRGRNVRRYLHLLQSIRASFPDLSRAQRRTVRNQIARSNRQLGYDAYRDGRFSEAARWFAHAFCHRPELAPLGEAVQAAGLSLLPRRWTAPADQDARRQDAARPVR